MHSLSSFLGKEESVMAPLTKMPEFVTPDDVLLKVPFGKFQKLLFAFHSVMYITTSILMYNVVFLLMYQVFLCEQTDPNNPD